MTWHPLPRTLPGFRRPWQAFCRLMLEEIVETKHSVSADIVMESLFLHWVLGNQCWETGHRSLTCIFLCISPHHHPLISPCCWVTSVVSDSVQPHPWDSPGKNTGVGCHFLLQCIKVKSESEVAQSCPTLQDPVDCSLPGSSVHGIFQARVLEWGAIAFSAHFSLRSTISRKMSQRHPPWLLLHTLPSRIKTKDWKLAWPFHVKLSLHRMVTVQNQSSLVLCSKIKPILGFPSGSEVKVSIRPILGFPGGSAVKTHLPHRSHRRCRVDPWVGKISWRRAWQPTPGFSPRESHRQRSLVGYSP